MRTPICTLRWMKLIILIQNFVGRLNILEILVRSPRPINRVRCLTFSTDVFTQVAFHKKSSNKYGRRSNLWDAIESYSQQHPKQTTIVATALDQPLKIVNAAHSNSLKRFWVQREVIQKTKLIKTFGSKLLTKNIMKRTWFPKTLNYSFIKLQVVHSSNIWTQAFQSSIQNIWGATHNIIITRHI